MRAEHAAIQYTVLTLGDHGIMYGTHTPLASLAYRISLPSVPYNFKILKMK